MNNPELPIVPVLRAYIGASGSNANRLAGRIGLSPATLRNVLTEPSTKLHATTAARLINWLFSVPGDAPRTIEVTHEETDD